MCVRERVCVCVCEGGKSIFLTVSDFKGINKEII